MTQSIALINSLSYRQFIWFINCTTAQIYYVVGMWHNTSRTGIKRTHRSFVHTPIVRIEVQLYIVRFLGLGDKMICIGLF